MQTNTEAAQQILGFIAKMPTSPQSLKGIIHTLSPPRKSPKKEGTAKEHSSWVSLSLLDLWWPHRHLYQPESRHRVQATHFVAHYDLGRHPAEINQYLMLRFKHGAAGDVCKKIIISYIASLICFLEKATQDPRAKELYQEACEIRGGDSRSDAFIFAYNFILAVPDLLQLLLIAVATLENTQGTITTKQQAERLCMALLPTVILASSHHNAVGGQSLRLLLGETGLSMYKVLCINEMDNKYVITISKEALAYVAEELSRISFLASEMLQDTEAGMHLNGLLKATNELSAQKEKEMLESLNDTSLHFFQEMWRADLMAKECIAGKESVGCPLALMRDEDGTNSMTAFSKEVLAQLVSNLYPQ